MPLAVTHILIPVILVDTLRDRIIKKKNILSNKFVLLAGLAGLLPDIDLPISLILGVDLHRTITHSIIIPLTFLFLFLVFLKKEKYSKIFLMFFIGFSFHILLDLIFGEVYILFPFSFEGYYLNLTHFSNLLMQELYTMIDAILLFFWLIHEELEHKISDYF
jgi:membrane-bound metal-dependent hydrolase YbcI (DUF457 family)